MNIIATALAFHPLHSLELHEKKSFLLAFVANDMVPKKNPFSQKKLMCGIAKLRLWPLRLLFQYRKVLRSVPINV